MTNNGLSFIYQELWQTFHITYLLYPHNDIMRQIYYEHDLNISWDQKLVLQPFHCKVSYSLVSPSVGYGLVREG